MLPESWTECNAIQRDVLTAVYAEGPATAAALSRRIDRHRSNTTRACRALADAGLLTREGEGGRGGITNSLTDKGRSVTVAALDRYREVL